MEVEEVEVLLVVVAVVVVVVVAAVVVFAVLRISPAVRCSSVYTKGRNIDADESGWVSLVFSSLLFSVGRSMLANQAW